MSTWGFRDQPLHTRKGTMGDIAEAVFEAVYPQGFTRYGINRPPIAVAMIPEFVRFTPDYLTSKGFVEVQGFGKAQQFNLKVAKYEALNEWHSVFRVDLFAYDSHNGRYGFIRLHDFLDAYEAHGHDGAYDGGRNPYIGVPAKHLPVDRWVDYEPADADRVA